MQRITEDVATCVSWPLLPKRSAVAVPQGSTCRWMERLVHLVGKKTPCFLYYEAHLIALIYLKKNSSAHYNLERLIYILILVVFIDVVTILRGARTLKMSVCLNFFYISSNQG